MFKGLLFNKYYIFLLYIKESKHHMSSTSESRKCPTVFLSFQHLPDYNRQILQIGQASFSRMHFFANAMI